MANMNGFNASNYDPMETFEAIPAGDYVAIATDSEQKPTKAGTGSYLQITWEIIEGEFKGRKLWSRLNLENTNVTAVEIAQRELATICRAVGVLQPRDSEELHGKPVTLKVGVEKRKDNDEMTNRIKGYSAVGGNGSATPAPAAAAPAAPSTSNKPAWRR